LDNAVNFAARSAETSNFIAFDGAVGGFNLTESLAELLKAKASATERKVEKDLLPKWCRQRNLKCEGNGSKINV